MRRSGMTWDTKQRYDEIPKLCGDRLRREEETRVEEGKCRDGIYVS